jgi:hypothetical protein
MKFKNSKTKNTQKGEPLTPIKASSGSIIQDTDIQKGVKTIFYDLSRGALEDYVNLHISEVCTKGERLLYTSQAYQDLVMCNVTLSLYSIHIFF